MRISDWSSDVCSSDLVAAYRDTLRLLLNYAAAALRRTPSAITLPYLDAPLLLAFLDHLEKDRGNSVRSRNARLAAIRTFLNMHRITTLRRWRRSNGRWRSRSSGSIDQWSGFCHGPRSDRKSTRLNYSP